MPNDLSNGGEGLYLNETCGDATMQVTCRNCRCTFETDNEDDMVQQLCPDCLDNADGLENPEEPVEDFE